MDTMSTYQWILAAAFATAAVLVAIAMARLIRNDGYGSGAPAVDPRSDWGTPTVPSHPYSRLS